MKKILLGLTVFTFVLSAHVFNVSTSQELSDSLYTAANNNEDDTIVLEAGTYLADDYIQFQYITDESSSLTIKAKDGLSRKDVIIDGDKKSRVLTLKYEGNTFRGLHTLENVTIRNGKTGTNGGGVYSSFGMILKGVDIINNVSHDVGSGIYLIGGIELYDSNISNNSGNTAIYQKPFDNSDRDSKIINSIISNNNSENKQMISLSSKNKVLTMKNSVFHKNSTTSYYSLFFVGGYKFVNMSDSNFTNNFNAGSIYITHGYTTANNLLVKDNNINGIVMTINNGIVENSVFTGNKSTYDTLRGGISVKKSKFIDNELAVRYVREVDSCIFIGNTKGAVKDTKYIKNSIFINNSSNEAGGAVHNNSSSYIINSIFKGNSSLKASAVYMGTKGSIINSVFINNHTSVDDATVYASGVFINNIFKDENATEESNNINYIGDSYLYNNYLDLAHTTNPSNYQIVQRNTLNPNSILDGMDDDFELMASSALINKGLNISSPDFEKLIVKAASKDDIDWIKNALKKDAKGNKRTYDLSTDLGAYEYGSSSVIPVIESIRYTGDPKIYEELSFEVNATFFDEKSLSSLTFDYENTGVYVSEKKHTYTKAGTYTVNVKLVDSDNDMVIASTSVKILPLAFNEMTMEQKIISLSKDKGKVDSIISEIKKLQKESQEYVLKNPLEFGLLSKSNIELTAENLTALKSGWTLSSTPFEIVDMTMFDNVKSVWSYDGSKWYAYSSNEAIKEKILNSSDISLLKSIPAGSGIWIEK